MNETYSLENGKSEKTNVAQEKVQEELVIEEAEEIESPVYSEPQNETVILGEVMIVDDDPETLFTINEIVESCNCRTILARNGVECIKLLEESTPDLILLDIMMPEMDGFQTIKKIKENGKWANIPVFAVTAKAMMEDKKIILKHGFDDYIPKPVNAGAMAFKVEKIFSKIKMNSI
jgi:two-component system chemotaxis sensor kinase CheA